MANITTSLFQEMVQAASTRLNKQAEYVNSLNVFPVPDGDTGTNMGMTIEMVPRKCQISLLQQLAKRRVSLRKAF